MSDKKVTAVKWYLDSGALTNDEVLAIVSEDMKTLSVVQNVNVALTSTSTMQWAHLDVPLSFDGEPHSIVLDTKANPAIKKESFFDINDGILHYSATNHSGIPLIAFKLTMASGWKKFITNGDGIYDVKDIEGDYNQVAGSVQNGMGNLIGAAMDIGAAVFGGPGTWATQGIATVGQLVAMHPDYGVRDPSTVKVEVINEITSKGFNEYISRLSTTAPKKTGYAGGETSSSQSPTTTMAMVGGLGIIALLMLFVAKQK